VLDNKSVRGPVAGSFAVGVLAGALLVAAPLAALTLTPSRTNVPTKGNPISASEPSSVYYSDAQDEPSDLPRIIAKGVSTSVATATAAIAPHVSVSPNDVTVTGTDGARVSSHDGMTVATARNGASVTLYPPDANGRRRMVAVAANGAKSVTYADADEPDATSDPSERQHRDETIDTAIGMKAVGITPEWVAEMRAASPALRNANVNELYGLKAVGATPDYVRELASAGFGNLGARELTEARAIGLTADYMRAIRATGVNATINDLVELRALGVRPDELARVRQVVGRREQEASPPRPPAPPSTDENDN
jgi:hypothetical protein